jgi:hypothetical protein
LPTSDTGADGAGIIATATNGAYCSGEGMVFDGDDDYVDVTTWSFGGAVTEEAYFNTNQNDGDRIFQFFNSDSNNNGLYAYVPEGQVGLQSRYDPATRTIFSDGLVLGSWTHVVFTVDSSGTLTLYVDNGSAVSSCGGSSCISISTLQREAHFIGNAPWASRNFDGTIAYLRFWHGEALDASQVAELYAARIDPTPAPTGTVAPTP